MCVSPLAPGKQDLENAPHLEGFMWDLDTTLCVTTHTLFKCENGKIPGVMTLNFELCSKCCSVAAVSTFYILKIMLR